MGGAQLLLSGPARPRRRADPRSRGRARGWTLIEATFGVATLGTIALVLALLLRASVNVQVQGAWLLESGRNARQALLGADDYPGLVQDIRSAKAVTSLAGSALNLTASDGAALSYSLVGEDLMRTKGGSSASVAVGVSTFSVNYYNLNSTPELIYSTTASDVRLVSVKLGMTRRRRTLYYHSTSRLRGISR